MRKAVGCEWEGGREARTGAVIVSSVHGRSDRYLGSCNDGPAAGGCVHRRSRPRRPRGKRNVPDHQHFRPPHVVTCAGRDGALWLAAVPKSSDQGSIIGEPLPGSLTCEKQRHLTHARKIKTRGSAFSAKTPSQRRPALARAAQDAMLGTERIQGHPTSGLRCPDGRQPGSQ